MADQSRCFRVRADLQELIVRQVIAAMKGLEVLDDFGRSGM